MTGVTSILIWIRPSWSKSFVTFPPGGADYAHSGHDLYATKSVDQVLRMSFLRAFVKAEFWLLVLTAAAGQMGLAWWVCVPLCLAGLSVSSLPKYVQLWPKAREVGGERVWWQSVGISVSGALAASVAAFVFGVALRVVFAT
jgi:hypothetical protein